MEMTWYARSIESVVRRAGVDETETDFMWRQIDPQLYDTMKGATK